MAFAARIRRTVACRFAHAALALPVAASALVAQRIEFTPFAAWRLFGQSGGVSVEASDAWGGIVQAQQSRRLPIGLEFLYSRQSSLLRVPPRLGGIIPRRIGVSIEQFAISGVRAFAKEDAATRPYTSLGLGWTTYSSGGFGTESRVLLAVGAGVHRRITPHVGAHLGTRGYFTITDTGSGFGCGIGIGTGSGCSIGFGGSGIFQLDLFAGVSVGFSPARPAR